MERISMKKVMKYDGYFRMLMFNGLVFIIIALYFALGQIDVGLAVYFFYGVAALSLLGVLLRYFYLSSFGLDLILTQATIQRIFYNRGMKIVTCTYKVNGITYKKRYAINYTKAVRDYQREDVLDILVKQEKPKHSLIRDLYFD